MLLSGDRRQSETLCLILYPCLGVTFNRRSSGMIPSTASLISVVPITPNYALLGTPSVAVGHVCSCHNNAILPAPG